jgi:hypothetical protein
MLILWLLLLSNNIYDDDEYYNVDGNCNGNYKYFFKLFY